MYQLLAQKKTKKRKKEKKKNTKARAEKEKEDRRNSIVGVGWSPSNTALRTARTWFSHLLLCWKECQSWSDLEVSPNSLILPMVTTSIKPKHKKVTWVSNGRNLSIQSCESAPYIRKTYSHRLKECRPDNSAPSSLHLDFNFWLSISKDDTLSPGKLSYLGGCFVHLQILIMWSWISLMSNK